MSLIGVIHKLILEVMKRYESIYSIQVVQMFNEINCWSEIFAGMTFLQHGNEQSIT